MFPPVPALQAADRHGVNALSEDLFPQKLYICTVPHSQTIHRSCILVIVARTLQERLFPPRGLDHLLNLCNKSISSNKSISLNHLRAEGRRTSPRLQLMNMAQEQTQSYSGGVRTCGRFWRNSGEVLWPQGSPEVCPGSLGLPRRSRVAQEVQGFLSLAQAPGGSWGRSVAGDIRRSCSETIPPSPFKLSGALQIFGRRAGTSWNISGSSSESSICC